MRVRNPQDLVAGLFFLALACGALWVAWDYPTVAVRSLAVDGPALSTIRLRAVLLVTAAVVIFAYCVQTLGLVIAAVLITLIGSLASPQMRPLEMVAAAAVLAAMTTAIFVWGIGLPIPIWPEF